MRLTSVAIQAIALIAACGYYGRPNGSSCLGLVHAEEKVADIPPSGAEKFSFEAEVHRMLDIVVNSLYQNKDVFLRELISNASDALDKIRYLVLTKPDEYKPAHDDIPLEVKLEYDTEQQTLTIRDTGVGMTRDDMIKNLGTVARSGTTRFIESLKESGDEDKTISQIGQFGVGFYSSFLVADRVTVASKSPLDPVQHVWESNNGSGDFLVYEDPRGNTLDRGTEITLYLKDDCLEYADPDRLRELAHHYSEFVMYPISLRTVTTMEVEVDDEDGDDDTADKPKDDDDDLEVSDDQEGETEEKQKKTKEVTTHSWDVLNDNQAIWTRDKDEVTDDEYQAFWKSLAGEYTDAATWVHFTAEGNINFKSILYLPGDVPPTYRMGHFDTIKGALRLYVRKVLIGDKFDLLPPYLNFFHGVVDSDDLPLNVNRETLQESKILQVIKKKLARKAIDLIRTYAKESETEDSESDDEAEAEIDADGNVVKKDKLKKEQKIPYIDWYKKFGAALKIGCIEDEPNQSKLLKLLRYESSKSDGKMISLEQYVANMKEWQQEIYVFGGSTVEEMKKSPFLEPFVEKDLEVLFMVDPIDEYMIKNVHDFNGKKFVQISSENVKFRDEDEDLIKRREKAYKTKFQPLTKWLRKLYKNTVLRVQVSKRSLGSVPAIVTSSDFGNSANMERIMKAQAFQQTSNMNQIMAMKIFEINPRHPLILKLLEGCPVEKKDGDDDDDDAAAAAAAPTEPSQEVIDAAWLLHDMAMINGGFSISDPAEHNKRLTKVLQNQFGLESLALEDEIHIPVEDDEPPEVGGGGGLNMEDFEMGDLNLDELGLNMDSMDDIDFD